MYGGRSEAAGSTSSVSPLAGDRGDPPSPQGEGFKTRRSATRQNCPAMRECCHLSVEPAISRPRGKTLQNVRRFRNHAAISPYIVFLIVTVCRRAVGLGALRVHARPYGMVGRSALDTHDSDAVTFRVDLGIDPYGDRQGRDPAQSSYNAKMSPPASPRVKKTGGLFTESNKIRLSWQVAYDTIAEYCEVLCK